MFVINNKIKGFNVKREQLVKLYVSTNEVEVPATPSQSAIARAYILNMRSKSGYNLYIALIFKELHRNPIFFEFHKNPLTESTAKAMEEEAISFINPMNFEMELFDLSSEGASEMIQQMGIFYSPAPTGAISLTPMQESITADGTSQVLVESQPIFDTDGDPVTDDTIFIISSSQGMIVHPLSQEKGESLEITSRSGFLTFAIESSVVVGLATIEAKSKEGNASGQTHVIFVPGEPNSVINLQPEKNKLYADGSTTITIASEAVTDSFGNMITDGSSFSISCRLGNLFEGAQRTGGKQIQIRSRGSTVRFYYKAGTKCGVDTIEAKSVQGAAKGSCTITLQAGLPHGEIVLVPESPRTKVSVEKKLKVHSQPIKDKSSNIVSDGSIFNIKTSLGLLSADTDEADSAKEMTVQSQGGVISFNVIPGQKRGNMVLSARSAEGDASGVVELAVQSGNPAGQIALIHQPQEIIADGNTVVTFSTTEVIQDSFRNIIEDGTPFTVRCTHGKLRDVDDAGTVFSSQGHLHFKYVPPIAVETDLITVSSVEGDCSVELSLALVVLKPSGTISLHTTCTSLTANQTDECDIESEVIRDSKGNPVADGTVINLSITLGEFVSFDGQLLGKQTKVFSSKGIIHCRVRVGNVRGTMVISASSKEGSAQGELSIPVLAEAPEGSIELRTESHSVVADGKSTIWVTSEPITDAYENVVDDGTLIAVECDNGTIVAEGSKITEEGVQCSTKQGCIRFQYRASTRPGHAQITAMSVDGFAMGTVDVVLQAGTPTGEIEFEKGIELTVPVGGESITLRSKPIFDSFGNPVSDTAKFTVSLQGPGTLTAPGKGESGDSLEIAPNNACLCFTYQAGEKAERATISVESVEGDARGTLRVQLTPGSPSGTISIIAPDSPYYSRSSSPLVFETEKITDRWGNVVADGSVFMLKMSPGLKGRARPDEPFREHEIEILSHDGSLAWELLSNLRGEATLQLSSHDGEAKGEMSLTFKPLPPKGEILLLPDGNDLVADGETHLFVTSETIVNQEGTPVEDECRFVLSVENGLAYVGDIEQAASEIEVLSSGGKIFFHLISLPVIGELIASVRSLNGSAKGECSINLVSGPPAGTVQFVVPETEIYAGSPDAFQLTSEVICDAFDNPISDEHLFTVVVQNGTISKEREGRGEVRLALKTTDSKLTCWVRGANKPGTILVEVWSADRQAQGKAVIPMQPAPLAPKIEFEEVEGEPLVADGDSLIEVHTRQILDVFGNPVEDNRPFNVTLQGVSGFGGNVSRASEAFKLFPENGRISFQLLAPEQTREAHITITDKDEVASGSLNVQFKRPEPQGEIILFSDKGNALVADGFSQSLITSDTIFTSQKTPVLDNEPFRVTAQLGMIKSTEHPDFASQITTEAQAGMIRFEYKVPDTVGHDTISVTSVNGEAKGHLDMQLTTGLPSGDIIFSVPQPIPFQGDTEPINLRSEKITDAQGRIVADGWEIKVSLEGACFTTDNEDTQLKQEDVLVVQDGVISMAIIPEPEAKNVTITAVSLADESDARGELSFELTPDFPAGEIELEADVNTLLADGRAIAKISSNVITTSSGKAVPAGEEFIVTCNRGSISASTGKIADEGMTISAENGKLHFSLRSSRKAGESLITVKSIRGTSQGSIVLTFRAGDPSGNITLLAEPMTIPADNTSQISITSEPITDAFGNTVADGTEILFETDLGVLLKDSPEDDPQTDMETFTVTVKNGVISLALRATNTAGVATIVAWSATGNAIGNLELFITALEPRGEITLLPSIQEPLADGQDTVVITSLPVKDSHGNYVSDSEKFRVSVVDSLGETRELEVFSANGKLECSIPPQTQAGEVTVTVESERGNAKGTCVLSYQPLIQEDASEEEWFFAAGETGQDEEEAFNAADDDLGSSIEESFSNLLVASSAEQSQQKIAPSSTRVEPRPEESTVTPKPGKSQPTKEIERFFTFLTGF